MWVFFFVKAGGLLGCILENVVGITHEVDGQESVIEMFLRVVRSCIPEFCWSVDVLKVQDFLLPQSRVRVFLRGMRRLVSDVVPSCLPPFGRRNIRACLGAFPHTHRSDYTLPQQDNLRHYEVMVREMVTTGKLSIDDVVICPVDRGEESAFKKCSINIAPTLTTHNTSLIVLSVRGVVEEIPDDKREFFRFLHDSERLGLQGLPITLIQTLPANKVAFAAGNAYPVPLIIATMQPMLMALSRPRTQSLIVWFFSVGPVGSLCPWAL